MPKEMPPPTTGPPIHDAIRGHLQRRGASFFGQLRAAVAGARSDDELLDALWDLVWFGEVTNDTFAALRALSLPRSRSRVGPVTSPSQPNASRRSNAVLAPKYSSTVKSPFRRSAARYSAEISSSGTA